MDGVFMRSLINRIFFCAAIVILVSFVALAMNNYSWSETQKHWTDMQKNVYSEFHNITDFDAAKTYLKNNIPKLSNIIKDFLGDNSAVFEDAVNAVRNWIICMYDAALPCIKPAVSWVCGKIEKFLITQENEACNLD
jgi:hypothetical protein